MERSEHTLVPEWLKNAGSSTGGKSITHIDDRTGSRVARNKPSVNNSNGHDFGRSSSSERTTSSYFRRSSSSNSSGNSRSYSSFGRNQHDREWEKDTYYYRDRDNSSKGDRWYRDFSDPLGNTSVSKFGRDRLKHSHSMASEKHGDKWPKIVVTGSIDANGKNANSVLTRTSPIGGVNKTAFERDFPTLGIEENAVTPEVGRVSSPGLSVTFQSLRGSSALMGGEKWTSALAEVPVVVGSNGTISAHSGSASGASSVSTTSLNMAEAVAQGPNRAQTTPQLSVEAQRLEELVIKQSRQLIPLTPSLPKPLALNYSDKHKSKVGPQQHNSVSSSLPVNHSPRGGALKGDAPKASTMGKLHVLKPAREKNGVTVTPVVKDTSSPTSDSKPVISSSLSSAVSGPTATRAPPNNVGPEGKPVLEKRATSKARSRNDFFNLMRKKSMASSPTADSAVAKSDFLDKCDEMEAGPTPSGFSPSAGCEEKSESCNDDGNKYVYSNGNNRTTSCDPVILEEEEAAFLRSLGWEENDDEEGGLTDEEITSFISDLNEYFNSNPSLKILQGVRLKFLSPLDSQVKCVDGKLES